MNELNVTQEEAVESVLADEAGSGEAGSGGEELAPTETEGVDASWQQRAEDAEARLAAVAEQLGEVEQTARELHEAIEVQRVGRLLDVELMRAGVSDLDAARSAVVGELASMEGEAGSGSSDSIEEAVGRLLVSRPGLFAGEAGAGGIGGAGGVMRSRASGARLEADRAAAAARSSGDRRALLAYLRLRRASA